MAATQNLIDQPPNSHETAHIHNPSIVLSENFLALPAEYLLACSLRDVLMRSTSFAVKDFSWYEYGVDIISRRSRDFVGVSGPADGVLRLQLWW
jgi:hypothetical protein